ncbi:MAG TPA: tetratricopeptide repeat protein [Gemmatimonadaceae bacterium]
MPSSRSRTRAWMLALALVALASGGARAQQGSALVRGQELEEKEQYAGAAAAYRDALAEAPASVPAVLGLERVYAQLGRSDSLLPVLDHAIALAPRVAALRAAKLRTLRSLGDRAKLRAAFDEWRHDWPRDPTPYREYARMLIDDGLTAQADTVLRLAQGAVGTGRGFDYELAQLHAAMGMWPSSAASWRVAVANNPYLDQAAIYSLVRTPPEQRDAVRRALAAGPPAVAPLRVLASLDVSWGDARAGWEAMSRLQPDSATVAAWVEFAQRAEEAEAWLVARDALVAAVRATPSAELVARAASDAMHGGDPASAAELAERAERSLDPAQAARTVVPVHLRALAALGKPAEAERLFAGFAPRLQPDERSRVERLVAWAWVRTGELDRAKEVLARAGDDPDDPARGWIALYEGDLALARRTLTARADATGDLLTAVALLERTKADHSDEVGRAFLTLARGDTLGAARAFEQAADALPEVAPLLQENAARLYAARGQTPRAVALWQGIVEHSPEAPEAPEAELEWARALRRAGETQAAVGRLEHLILTYPESALVPQARHELELARRSVPPTS